MPNIPVNDKTALKEHGIPFSTSTLYKWHHMWKFKTMFIKMGGFLFVDVNEFAKIMEAHRGK